MRDDSWSNTEYSCSKNHSEKASSPDEKTGAGQPPTMPKWSATAAALPWLDQFDEADPNQWHFDYLTKSSCTSALYCKHRKEHLGPGVGQHRGKMEAVPFVETKLKLTFLEGLMLNSRTSTRHWAFIPDLICSSSSSSSSAFLVQLCLKLGGDSQHSSSDGCASGLFRKCLVMDI
jgi:hypothetical protein